MHFRCKKSMMRSFLHVCIGLVCLLTACTKPVPFVPDTKAALTITTHFVNGSSTSVQLDAAELKANSYIGKVNNGGGDLPFMSITGVNQEDGKEYVFTFAGKQAGSHELISATHNFPAANQQVRPLLGIVLSPSSTEYSLEPAAGSIALRYDAVNKVMSGEIVNLRFNQGMTDPLQRSHIIVNGSFQHLQYR
jgi:hypothetical protein